MKAKKAGAKTKVSSPSATSSASKAVNKNTQDIENLIGFVSESGLAEVNIETSEFKLHIKRYADAVNAAPVVMSAPVVQHTAATSTPSTAASSEKATDSASGKNTVTIKSPMIGTFYRSSNPESGPFVNVGDEIKAGQPVCIIEAMKLFNEIEAEISGKIIKILVDNASPVEYDQPLFLIEPK